MNFEINEMEFYPVPKISQLSSYDTSIIEGEKINEIYKTSICIKLEYINNELQTEYKDIILPFELNLGDKELTKLDIINVDIQVIDNQGLNIEYNLNVEISEVVLAENILLEEAQVIDISNITNIEEVKEEISSSYETIVESTGIREELPVSYVEKEDLGLSNLTDDFMEVKVLFNINVDEVDKLAFKHNLSIDSCYKKMSIDKTRLII
ncbi:MAG: hypothetical protein R3Y05_03440 [bacterium]